MVTIEQNANKAIFMCSIYPDLPLTKIATMFQLPAIDINSAIWYAIERGWLTDNGDGVPPTINENVSYDLGEDVEGLQDMILAGLRHVAKVEKDIEEGFLVQWCNGHPGHTLLFAVKDLIRTGQIGTYSVEDLEPEGEKSTYTFYSLPENVDKQWGKREFKNAKSLQDTEPTTSLDAIKEDELPDAPEEPIVSSPTKH